MTRPAAIGEIIARVSFEMGVSQAEIRACRSSKRGGRARNAISWLAYRATTSGSGVIGASIGVKGRAVLRAIERAEALRRNDPAFARLTARLLEQLTGERP